MRIRVSRLRPWRMISWPAACGIRWVKPSSATVSPSRTADWMASASDEIRAMRYCFPVAAPYLRPAKDRVKWRNGHKLGLQQTAMLGKEPIFTIRAELSGILNLGRTPYGERRIIDITGGTVRGPQRPHPAGRRRLADLAQRRRRRYPGALYHRDRDGRAHPGHQRRLAAWSTGGHGAAGPGRQRRSRSLLFSHRDAVRDFRRKRRLAQPHSGAGARAARSPKRAARCLRGGVMATELKMTLPASLAAERQGDVAILRLKRPEKRNALDDETILG